MKSIELLRMVKRTVLVLIVACVGLWAENYNDLAYEDELKLRLMDEAGEFDGIKDYYAKYGPNVAFCVCSLDFQDHSCYYIVFYLENVWAPSQTKRPSPKASVPENENLKNTQSMAAK